MSYHRPPQPAMSGDQAEAWRRGLRYEGDGLDGGFARPDDVEPLASRLERAHRVIECRAMTRTMLNEWADQGAPVTFHSGVGTRGLQIDFLGITWKGVFCVWSIDHRWTVDQAALVQPARAQIQAELPGFSGKVEAIFHSPREATESSRQLMVHPDTDEPMEIVTVGGQLAQVLHHWQPVGGVGLDPEWMMWLSQAAMPRWWRSDEGRPTPGAPDPHDELD